jgi:hypothetical protein
MKIHKEGYNSIAAVTILIAALAVSINYFFPCCHALSLPDLRWIAFSSGYCC